MRLMILPFALFALSVVAATPEEEAKAVCIKAYTIKDGTNWTLVEECIKQQLAARKRVEGK